MLGFLVAPTKYKKKQKKNNCFLDLHVPAAVPARAAAFRAKIDLCFKLLLTGLNATESGFESLCRPRIIR